MATLRLKRLQIDRFRNVAPGTVLVFNDGMNVLLGPNGAGKTTLLKLIAAIVRDIFTPLADDEIDITYDVEVLSVLFRVHLINRRSSRARGRAAFPESSRDPDWHFQVSVCTISDQHPILEAGPLGTTELIWRKALPVVDPFEGMGPVLQASTWADLARKIITDAGAAPPETIAPILQAWKNLDDLRPWRWSLMMQGGRFDEGLGTFADIIGARSVSEVPDRIPAVLTLGETTRGMFVPADLVRAVSSIHQRANGSDVTLTHDELPFLKAVVDLFRAQHAKMILRLQTESHEGTKELANFEFLFTLDDGSVIRHDLLSWGQKRILSFFYYAAANPDILVVDELVNGLHHEWIAACLKEMEGRQCFLTSQNPLLLDQLVFNSAEDVRRTFIQCRREKGERRAELHWHPMDEASAESFFRAYRVGIQHVGEILRTKGLW